MARPYRQQDGRALPPSRPQGGHGQDGANHFRTPRRQRAGADWGGKQSCSRILNPASATARGNAVKIMIRAIGINSTIGAGIATLLLVTATVAKIDRICPSVCPSDWDRCETSSVSACAKVTCESLRPMADSSFDHASLVDLRTK